MSIPMVMPRAGLSFADVSLAALECRGNLCRTAKRLGVDESALRVAVRRENIQHWFVSGPGNGYRPRKRCISAEDIRAKAELGMSSADAAVSLCVSRSFITSLAAEYGISFANSVKYRNRSRV